MFRSGFDGSATSAVVDDELEDENVDEVVLSDSGHCKQQWPSTDTGLLPFTQTGSAHRTVRQSRIHFGTGSQGVCTHCTSSSTHLCVLILQAPAHGLACAVPEPDWLAHSSIVMQRSPILLRTVPEGH